MRLFSARDLVGVALVLLSMLSLNCQRITSIPTLFAPAHPPLVRLATEDYPVFSDTIDRDEPYPCTQRSNQLLCALKKTCPVCLREKKHII